MKLCYAIFFFFVSTSLFAEVSESLFVNDSLNLLSSSIDYETFLKGLASRFEPAVLPLQSASRAALFDFFPNCASKLPYISLGSFPTTVQKVDLSDSLSFYIKRDDLGGCEHEGCPYPVCTHARFGGGKVRKLEFIFADAVRNKARSVMAVAKTGSNHAAAVAFYAHSLGLEALAILENDSPSAIGRRNMLVCGYYNVDMQLCYDEQSKNSKILFALLKRKLLHGDFPYIIPEKSDSMLDAVAFVSAAFELKKQIDDGLLPEPDYIYMPMGTTRSVAGLLLGLRASGLKAKVCVLKVNPDNQGTKREILVNARRLNVLLRLVDESFPEAAIALEDVRVVAPGDEPVDFSPAVTSFISTMQDGNGITLADDYGKKALSLFIFELQKRGNEDVVLFWNTYYDNSVSHMTSSFDYKLLPREFHAHFA